jgi:hypothetical protein
MEIVEGLDPKAPLDESGNSSMTQISTAGLELLKGDSGLVVSDRAARAAELAAARAALTSESACLAALERDLDAN